MVILYSLLPIIKNTYTGIQSIPDQTLEAAKGIGMTRAQILIKVQIPMALPIIMAGVRISAVTAVGLMTIAAFIGAGGLGYLVYSGIRTSNNMQILAVQFLPVFWRWLLIPYGNPGACGCSGRTDDWKFDRPIDLYANQQNLL